MSAKKNWSLVMELTQCASGEHHVAQARSRFKKLSRRYVRRAMKREIDMLLVEVVDQAAIDEQITFELERRDEEEYRLAMDLYDEHLGQSYDEDPYFNDDLYSDFGDDDVHIDTDHDWYDDLLFSDVSFRFADDDPESQKERWLRGERI
jgi:hypothetical protein